MTHLRLRNEFEGGRTAEVTPTLFFPLTSQQLLNAVENPSTPVELEFLGTETVVDGVPHDGTARLTMKVTFLHTPAPYALVLGGWLPMPFVIPQHFLVDRNVVSTIRSISARGAREDQFSFAWWTRFLEGGSGLFNPLLYAFEGSRRRTPTLDEFILAYEEGCAELRRAFPRATVVGYNDEHFEAAYPQLEALAERGKRDAQFLLEVLPLVHDRVPRGRERRVQDRVLQLATNLGVLRNAPVVLAVLSILYEDVQGKVPSIGRSLLKPKRSYTAEDAYNAVNDLRHIEVAALSHAVLPGQGFALCTNDRAIAMFWSSLEFRGEASDTSLLNLEYSLGKDLLPRLDDDAIKLVMEALNQ